MKRRAHVYKRASAIMLSLMIAGSSTIGIFAENVNKQEPTKQEITTPETEEEEKEDKSKSTQPYIQNYDAPEGITWTHIKDNGTTAVENGFLKVTNQGDYRVVENQSNSLEDGELEFRFQASKENTGRFGAIFRASGDNHGFVGYDSNGSWVVEDKEKYKTFKGPVLEAEDWATVRVMFIGNHITVKILDESTKEFKTYFDEVVDFIPVQEGKAGYRSWWNSKTTSVDYLKYGPVGSLDEGGTVPDISIESIQPVEVSTFKRLKPELPKRVKVTYNNGATGNADVKWDYIEPSKYAEAGEFEVQGSVGGTDVKAVAKVIVRGDALVYQPDYSNVENQGWKTTKGGGKVSYEGNTVTVGMNGVSLAVDEKSPKLKDFTYESTFKTTNNDGRIGIMFRYASDNDFGAICYDNGGWIWKAYNNGKEQYGGFGGSSVKIEANQTYNLKLKVVDNNVSLWIDDELVGSQAIASLPSKEGQIGLHGWYGNKNVTIGNVKVEEILPLLPPEVGETQEQVIQSDDMKVVLDNNFPRAIRYEWKEDGSILEGESEQLYIMEINNDKYIPKVECVTKDNKTTYKLSIEEIGVEVTLDMYVNNNKLRMEVTNIKESGNTKVKTINFPKHSLASVKSSDNGKTASVLTTGDWNNIIEEFKEVKDLDESS
ncbi:MAG: Ig-like domain-containing protein, partial [Peptostreptococcaceae bacterium]